MKNNTYLNTFRKNSSFFTKYSNQQRSKTLYSKYWLSRYPFKPFK